jgi:hypothetical protein
VKLAAATAAGDDETVGAGVAGTETAGVAVGGTMDASAIDGAALGEAWVAGLAAQPARSPATRTKVGREPRDDMPDLITEEVQISASRG